MYPHLPSSVYMIRGIIFREKESDEGGFWTIGGARPTPALWIPIHCISLEIRILEFVPIWILIQAFSHSYQYLHNQ